MFGFECLKGNAKVFSILSLIFFLISGMRITLDRHFCGAELDIKKEIREFIIKSER